MKRWLIAALLVVGMAASAFGQTVPKVSFQKGTLSWDYTQGTSPATEFRMKCGVATNTYTKITVVPVTQKVVNVNLAIPAVGTYFCVVTAANEYGESNASNEVNFTAGNAPSDPTNLRLGTVGASLPSPANIVKAGR